MPANDGTVVSWMGDSKLNLMDVNTELPAVQITLQEWIGNFTKEFSIDGLRIDGRGKALSDPLRCL